MIRMDLVILKIYSNSVRTLWNTNSDRLIYKTSITTFWSLTLNGLLIKRNCLTQFVMEKNRLRCVLCTFKNFKQNWIHLISLRYTSRYLLNNMGHAAFIIYIQGHTKYFSYIFNLWAKVAGHVFLIVRLGFNVFFYIT